MAQLKRKVLKKYSSILTLLVSILGFSVSCEKTPIGEPGGGGIIAMYGVIAATHITIKGKIKSSETNKSIKNIQVIASNDTAYSNSFGNYKLNFSNRYTDHMQVQYNDVDGSANGSFYNKEVIVNLEPKNPDNYGDMQAEADVILDPK